MAVGNTVKKYKFYLQETVDNLTTCISHAYVIRLLRKLVYGWFLLNTLILLPASDKFWGVDSLIPSIGTDIVESNPVFYLLNFKSITPYYQYFVFLQIVLLILGILCFFPRIISLMIYIVTLNLDNKAYVILDGGNNLMQILMIYLIFMDPSTVSNKHKYEWMNQINNVASNLSFYMVRLQVVILYLVSGLAKIDGTLWQNGTALYYTLNIDAYSHPIAKSLVSNYEILTVVGTYATLVYQLAFPWMVWNLKIRPYLLAFGTFIHIQISFVMGLFMFGLAIAVAYFSFMTNDAAKKLLGFRIQFIRKGLIRPKSLGSAEPV